MVSKVKIIYNQLWTNFLRVGGKMSKRMNEREKRMTFTLSFSISFTLLFIAQGHSSDLE